MKLDRPIIIAFSLWVFCLVLSLGFFLLTPHLLSRAVLYFPESISHRTSPEVRFLPFTWDQQHNLELVTQEVLLGPAKHQHQRIFSRKSHLNAIIAGKSTIYVDLSKDSFIPDADVLYSPIEALDVLRKTLLGCFTMFTNVEVSVDGQPVSDKFR